MRCELGERESLAQNDRRDTAEKGLARANCTYKSDPATKHVAYRTTPLAGAPWGELRTCREGASTPPAIDKASGASPGFPGSGAPRRCPNHMAACRGIGGRRVHPRSEFV